MCDSFSFICVFSGGSHGTYLSSTEIFQDTSFRPGPELPLGTYKHCMIRVNDTHAMLTGGISDGSDSQVQGGIQKRL